MKSELKNVILNINPKLLGIKKIRITSFKKLGIGEGNINYILKIESKQFVCRISMRSGDNKLKQEFQNLRDIENLGVAPKALYFHKGNSVFSKDFAILEFFEGTPFRMGGKKFRAIQIKKVARVLAKVHSKKINYKKSSESPYIEVFNWSKIFIRRINKYTDSKYQKELKKINLIIKNIIPRGAKSVVTLTHGDVCPSNIIETSKDVRLIDWECSSYSDPAQDIANVILDLGLVSKDLDIFLSEYFKIRKDNRLVERLDIHKILAMNNYFLWEIARTFEIINKELPEEYLQKTTAKSHLRAAKKNFKQLRKMIRVPLFDIELIFANSNV